MTPEKRYCILGRTQVFGVGGQWLAYPITHYSFERGTAEVDRLNNEVDDADEKGHCYPFIQYELIPVSTELVGQWDEDRKAAAGG